MGLTIARTAACLAVLLTMPLAAPVVLGAQSGPAGAVQPPVLTAFSINGATDTVSAAAPTVTLVHTLVGAKPSEYRVSRRADFAGAPWLPYVPAPAARDWYDAGGESCAARGGRGSHRVTLYLQVRSSLGEEVRIVDGQRQLVPARVESNVLRATICALGAP